MKRGTYLVIGGGIAGLSFALRAADSGQVLLILKDEFGMSSTQLAQGGINAVLGTDDSFEAHINDTMDCGYGLCDPDIVQLVVTSAPDAIRDLEAYGTQFTRHNGQLSLHREGGHSHHRVVHAHDATGAEIMKALKQRTLDHPNIQVFSHHMAIDLIMDGPAGGKVITEQTRTIGAYVLDTHTNRVTPFLANITYLATGGIGKVYQYTSNPRTATGDGIAMAARAGLEVVNMEFVQFHPTLLYHPSAQSFLITEALRGEGGRLIDHRGHRFMADYHAKLMELAPRDVVARAIDSEIKKSGEPCIYLDLTHLQTDRLKDGYPNIYGFLKKLDIDFTRDPIPVVPAAHYSCGGLKVDRYGATSCAGLFAGGETTCTGLHGANRLASNSLLEAAVFGKVTAQYIAAHPELTTQSLPSQVADWIYHDYSDEYEESLVHPLWAEVRQFMWNYVGIIRTDKRLSRAVRRIEFLRQEIESSYWNFRISQDLIELRNISIIAELIIRSALARKESRGAHYNADHHQADPHMAIDTRMQMIRHGIFR